MTLRNVLVTTDFSPECRKAYRCSADLARKFGARLHLVHVEDALPPIFSEVSAESHLEELEGAVRHETRNPAFHDVEVIPHLSQDRQPFTALREIEEAEDIDLVVTSTHGKTGVERFLLGSFAGTRGVLGSVAQNVVREVPCSVLTVRKEADGAPRQ